MADYPQFVRDGQITQDGQFLLEFMHAQFDEADKSNDVARLNSLHGPIAEYYTVAYKLGLKTATGWFESFPQSARNAYDLMKYVESVAEKDAKLDETADKTNTLSAELLQVKEALETELETMRAEIAELKAEKASLAEADEPQPDKQKAPGKKRGAKPVAAQEADESTSNDADDSGETE